MGKLRPADSATFSWAFLRYAGWARLTRLIFADAARGEFPGKTWACLVGCFWYANFGLCKLGSKTVSRARPRPEERWGRRGRGQRGGERSEEIDRRSESIDWIMRSGDGVPGPAKQKTAIGGQLITSVASPMVSTLVSVSK